MFLADGTFNDSPGVQINRFFRQLMTVFAYARFSFIPFIGDTLAYSTSPKSTYENSSILLRIFMAIYAVIFAPTGAYNCTHHSGVKSFTFNTLTATRLTRFFSVGFSKLMAPLTMSEGMFRTANLRLIAKSFKIFSLPTEITRLAHSMAIFIQRGVGLVKLMPTFTVRNGFSNLRNIGFRPSSCGIGGDTFFAAPTGLSSLCIRFVKRMTLNAMSFSSVYRIGRCSSKNIFSQRHWFKMVWVHTVPNATKMVQSKSSRDPSLDQHIGYAMRTLGTLILRRTPISPCVSVSLPKPASWSLFNFIPESFHCRGIIYVD